MIKLGSAFAAGWTTLSFQVCLIRLANIFFGATSETLAIVISTSLIGLSLGALATTRLSRNLLSTGSKLAICFLVSGIWCVATTRMASPLGGFFGLEIGGLGDSDTRIPCLVYCLVIVFPFNFFQGAIVPLLVAQNSKTNFLTDFSAVYSAETMGAATGAIVTGFWKINSLGVFDSISFLGAISLCFAAITWMGQEIKTNAANVDENETESAAEGQSRKIWKMVAVVFLTGICSLGFEILLQRLFVLLFGSDSLGFALVVAVFLVGLSLGAIASRILNRWRLDLLSIYGTILIAYAISTMIVTYILIQFNSSAIWGPALGRWLVDEPFFSRVVLATTVSLPCTFLLGLAFPIAVTYVEELLDGSQKGVGAVYFAALLGNLAGLLLTGFFLVPHAGLRLSTIVLASIAFLIGVVSTIPKLVSNRSKALQFLILATLAAAFGSIFLASYLVVCSPISLSLSEAGERWSVRFYSDKGPNTVTVLEDLDDPDHRVMLIDGVSIGESGGGLDEKQQLLANLPFILGGDSKRQILTIGLGSGVLANELVKSELSREVICVEISQQVIDACEEFSDLNSSLKDADKFELIRTDGIKYLRRGKLYFDTIISDGKSRPGHSGNVGFYSREFYQACQQVLCQDNGLFVQWIGLNTSQKSLETIFATFCNAFPFGHVAISAPDSVFLIGSNQPIQLNCDWIDQYLAKSNLLKSYNWTSSDDILSMYWIDQQILNQELVASQSNSIFQPVLERSAWELATTGQDRNEQLRFLLSLVEADSTNKFENSRFNGSLLADLNLSQQSRIEQGRLAAQEMIRGAIQMTELRNGWLDTAAAHFKSAVRYLPNLNRQASIAEVFQQISSDEQSDRNTEFTALLNLRELGVISAKNEFRMGQILSSLGEHEKSLDFYYRASKLAKDSARYRAEFGCALFASGRINHARRQIQLAEKIDHNDALVVMMLALLDYQNGDLSAINRIENAIQLDSTLQHRLNRLRVNIDR